MPPRKLIKNKCNSARKNEIKYLSFTLFYAVRHERVNKPEQQEVSECGIIDSTEGERGQTSLIMSDITLKNVQRAVYLWSPGSSPRCRRLRRPELWNQERLWRSWACREQTQSALLVRTHIHFVFYCLLDIWGQFICTQILYACFKRSAEQLNVQFFIVRLKLAHSTLLETNRGAFWGTCTSLEYYRFLFF